jgi:hypothetical protein
MTDGKSALSEAQTYQEIASFWDTHDLSDFWDQTNSVAIEVEGTAQATYYPVDFDLKDVGNRGGGPHYVIDPDSGEIKSKRYEQ